MDHTRQQCKPIKPIRVRDCNASQLNAPKLHATAGPQDQQVTASTSTAINMLPSPQPSHTVPKHQHRRTSAHSTSVYKKGPPKFHKKSPAPTHRRPPDPQQRTVPPAPTAPTLAAATPPGTTSSPAARSVHRNRGPAPYLRPSARHLAAPNPTPATPTTVTQPTPVLPSSHTASPAPRSATRRPRPPEFQPSSKRTRQYLPRRVKRQTVAPPKTIQKKARIELIAFTSHFIETWPQPSS